MSKSGSKIREQVAHFLVDIHTCPHEMVLQIPHRVLPKV